MSLRKALERIVSERDFSMSAAASLESVIAQAYSEDPRFEDLQDILASYRPGGGEFLYDEKNLEQECSRVLKLL